MWRHKKSGLKIKSTENVAKHEFHNFCSMKRRSSQQKTSKHLDRIWIKSIKILQGKETKKERHSSGTEWKTRINKALNRVEGRKKLGNCTEKFRIFLHSEENDWFICLFWCRMCQLYPSTKTVYNILSFQKTRRKKIPSNSWRKKESVGKAIFNFFTCLNRGQRQDDR